MNKNHFSHFGRGQGGASLIAVLLVLLVVTVLGVGGAQIALMSERGARNERDMQVAWQAAEAALADAEWDMNNARKDIFDGFNRVNFIAGCGTGAYLGLCKSVDGGKPAWLAVDFTDSSDTAKTVAYGQLTGKVFSFGASGIRPAKAPRYVIEAMVDDSGTEGAKFVYRVTAMGFGPRPDIQAVIQMIYRI